MCTRGLLGAGGTPGPLERDLRDPEAEADGQKGGKQERAGDDASDEKQDCGGGDDPERGREDERDGRGETGPGRRRRETDRATKLDPEDWRRERRAAGQRTNCEGDEPPRTFANWTSHRTSGLCAEPELWACARKKKRQESCQISTGKAAQLGGIWHETCEGTRLANPAAKNLARRLLSRLPLAALSRPVFSLARSSRASAVPGFWQPGKPCA